MAATAAVGRHPTGLQFCLMPVSPKSSRKGDQTDVTNMAEEKVPLLQPEGPNEDVTWDSKTAHPAPSSSKVSYGTSSSQHPTTLCGQQLVTRTDQRTVNSHTQQPAMGIGHPASDPVIQQPAGLRQTQLIDGYPYQAAAINVHPKDRYKVFITST